MRLHWKSMMIRICLLLAIFSCSFSVYAGIDHTYVMGIAPRLLCAIAFVIPLGIASYLLAHDLEDEQRKTVYHIFWIILFLYYILQLGYMLFFASEFSRQGNSLFDGNYLHHLQEQWEYRCNLVPFSTIHLMLRAYRMDLVDLANINLLGNIVAFMPFAFFLPKLFPSMQKMKKFLLCMAVTIIAVEVTQFFTLSGTLDIDDFILNMSGVSSLYFILKIPVCRRLLKHIHIHQLA